MSKIGVTQQHILTNWLFENIRERRVCVCFFHVTFSALLLFFHQNVSRPYLTRPQTVQQAYYVLLRCCHNTTNRSLVTYKSAK